MSISDGSISLPSEVTYTYEGLVSMKLPDFVMLWGLPGSGKSTYAKNNFSSDYVILSSDDIREKVFHNVNDMDNNAEVFNIMKKTAIENLQKGQSVVYDATNLSFKKRMNLLDNFKNIKCNKIIHCFIVPIDVCRNRNNIRDRNVPNEVISRLSRSLMLPYFYEGWDKIYLHITNDVSLSITRRPEDFINSLMEYDQQNNNHTQTLGAHCYTVSRHIRRYIDSLACGSYVRKHTIVGGALLHDIGKPITRTIVEGDRNVHYYGHASVGAYISLFFNSTRNFTEVYGNLDDDLLYRAILIQWHMKPYDWESPNNKNPNKNRNKYKNIWGDDLYEDIMAIHEADKYAH